LKFLDILVDCAENQTFKNKKLIFTEMAVKLLAEETPTSRIRLKVVRTRPAFK
jgi:hypothetical protein